MPTEQAVPARLRARIWTTYKPGQEATMTPSAAYTEAAKAAQAWIAEQAHQGLLTPDAAVRGE